MCGIVLARERNTVDYMLERLAHRGKDDKQIMEIGGWHVGHVRLSIVDRDEEGASQPVRVKESVTAFNGEIYNYKEIYQAMETKPKYRTEIRVLDQLMAAHDEFERVVDGYYGIIRVDAVERRITLARDLFGVIPLYYSLWNGKLDRVASEKKACGSPVYEVRAGATESFDIDGVWKQERKQDYFSLHLEPLDGNHLEFLFRRAVERRVLHAEVPITVALSGGLDSSLVLWALKDLEARKRVTAITIGVDSNSDEVKNAELLAKDARVDWHFVQVTQKMVDDEMEKILYHLEDTTPNPIKWRGMLRNYFVAKHAPGVVILCGEGADEIGAGYPSHERAGNGLQLEWKVLSTIRSMPAINLDRVNKGGMAWTKEFRTPFLDRALVLYLMGCRKELRKGAFRKLAQLMELPTYILEKPKYGTEERKLEQLMGV